MLVSNYLRADEMILWNNTLLFWFKRNSKVLPTDSENVYVTYTGYLCWLSFVERVILSDTTVCVWIQCRSKRNIIVLLRSQLFINTWLIHTHYHTTEDTLQQQSCTHQQLRATTMALHSLNILSSSKIYLPILINHTSTKGLYNNEDSD